VDIKLDVMKLVKKLVRFVILCLIIAGFMVSVLWLVGYYKAGQNSKIIHYNSMVDVCNNTPGATIKFKASTPVFGAGVEMTCEYVVIDLRLN